MKRYGWLVALGLGAAAVFALLTLPASVIGKQLRQFGLDATAYQGSVWSGEARNLAADGSIIGDLRWKISPLGLLRLRLSGHLLLTRQDGRLETDFEAGLSGKLRLRSAELRLPLPMFDSLPIGVPSGWRGQVSGTIEELLIVDAWPTRLIGNLNVDSLTAPPPRNVQVGSFRLTMPDTFSPAKDGELSARIVETDGPLSVDARLTLESNRNFLLEGTIAPKGAVAPGLERSLRLLGPADAGGRREFSIAGSI